MSQIEACAPVARYPDCLQPRASEGGTTAASELSVEVTDGRRLAELHPHWSNLIERADAANVFMHPELVSMAAHAYADETIRACVAWSRKDGAKELAGLWAFSVARARKSLVPVTVLHSPAFPNAYLATPVLDRTLLDELWTAMLDRLAAEPTVPKIAVLEAMTMEGTTMAALARVIAARGSRIWLTDSTTRPRLASDLDGKRYLDQALSSSSRKKLRQHRNRLGRQGTLASAVIRDPAGVARAVEQFLQLEAQGWKGKNGTALLSNAHDAAFTRAAVAALANEGRVAIYVLSLDARPLSMQIVL